MPSFSTLISGALLVAIAAATPLPLDATAAANKGFTIHQNIAKPYAPGPVALMETYIKYNITVPTDVKAAAADGTVGAIPEPFDSQYLSPVSIGGQTLNLDFDTGSSDLWVFSSQLSASQRAGHSYYDPSRSSTAQQLPGYTWSISYGDGSSASGIVYTDTVSVGSTVVTGQAVELASRISASFQQNQNNDGLLGLGFSNINTVKPRAQTTFFDTAIARGVLSNRLFTCDLKKGAPGTYDFGFINNAKYTGAITYTRINSGRGFWEFTGTGYGVGSTFTSTSIDAIADTGTTLILVDDSIVRAYYAQVSGARYDSTQGGYVFSCNARLPDFFVGIEGFRARVPGTFINFAPVSNTICFGGIQSNQGLGLSIYGDVFLKAVFAVFDQANLRFGVAAKNL